jgi:hypothetical protein
LASGALVVQAATRATLRKTVRMDFMVFGFGCTKVGDPRWCAADL